MLGKISKLTLAGSSFLLIFTVWYNSYLISSRLSMANNYLEDVSKIESTFNSEFNSDTEVAVYMPITNPHN